MASTVNTWRVLWNAKFWDYTSYLENVRENKMIPVCEESYPAQNLPYSFLPQSKGKKDYEMSEEPKVGDNVIFVVCGVKNKPWLTVAEGTVCSEFQDGNHHQHYPTNKGETRKHAENSKFLWINVKAKKMEEYAEYKKDGQRTWRKL
jgi:hypothetical protein